MPEHDELLALMPAHALGALDGDDLRRVERHLDRGCDECERELLEATRQVEKLAETVTPTPPSDLLRARLDRELDRRQPRVQPAWVKRAAIVALALLASWSLWDRTLLREEVDRLSADRTETMERLAGVQQQLDQARTMLARLARAGRIVSAPGARQVVLAGLELTPTAQGQTFVDPVARSAVFYATGLPALTEEETYQLWFIADGTPVSAGTFDVEDDGSAMLLVEATAAVDEIQLWAVTIEPAGGVPQPTGAMVLKG